MTTIRTPRRFVLALLSAGLMAGLPATSWGQGRISGSSTPSTPAAPSPLIEAGKQVTTAEKALVDAQKHLQAAKGKIAAQFASKPEWAKAKTNLEKAKFEEERARTMAMGTLEKKPDYKAAKAAREAANQKYTALQNSGKSGGDEFGQVAQEKLDRGLEMKNLEKQTLENDPKYVEAKSKLTQAQQEWDALQPQVEQAAQTDPDCLQAQQEVDAATQQLTAAKQNKAQIAKGIADARAAETKQKAEAAKANRGGGGGGGIGGGGARRY